MKVTVPGFDPETEGIDIVFRRFDNTIVCKMFDNYLSSCGNDVCEFTGVAKCQACDDFDWKTGKEIAVSHAFIKRFKEYCRYEDYVVEELYNVRDVAISIVLNKIRNNRR